MVCFEEVCVEEVRILLLPSSAVPTVNNSVLICYRVLSIAYNSEDIHQRYLQQLSEQQLRVVHAQNDQLYQPQNRQRQHLQREYNHVIPSTPNEHQIHVWLRKVYLCIKILITFGMHYGVSCFSRQQYEVAHPALLLI